MGNYHPLGAAGMSSTRKEVEDDPGEISARH